MDVGPSQVCASLPLVVGKKRLRHLLIARRFALGVPVSRPLPLGLSIAFSAL